MTIEPLTRRDVDEVAALHGEALRGLLTRLGPRAIRAYYTACAESAFATGLVVRGSGGLDGFVLGSADPAQLRRELILRNPDRFLTGIAMGVLRRPSTLWWLIMGLRGPSSGQFDNTCPELTYLAVAPSRRGRGVGRQLVQAFSSAMRAAGHTRYELSVDADNRDAERFYKQLGFVRVGEYDEFGIRRLRYALTLPAGLA